MSETKTEGPMNANLQPGANYNLVGLAAQNGRSTLYYIPADATLALDQGISPQWTSAHSFLRGIAFDAAASASMSLDLGVSLNYSVGQGVHVFYVNGKAVGRIDDPSSPNSDTSLVSKSYVDAHGGGNSVQPGKPAHPAVSIGAAVKDGTALTYMRSDVVLGLDQTIAPQWSGVHTFKTDADFQGSVNLAQGAQKPAGALTADGASLKYAVTSADAVHAFYVGENLAAQIDNPSDPQTNDSLVSKAYVDKNTLGTSAQYVAFSSLPLGNAAPASVDQPSHGSLAIGQNAAVSSANGASANGALALGTESSVQNAPMGTAIGWNAVCTGEGSIAFGGRSSDGGNSYVLSVGCTSEEWSGPVKRRIINVADGQNDSDAATVRQLKSNRYLAVCDYNDGVLPKSDGAESIALGANSWDQAQCLVLSIGSSLGGVPVVQRRIINVSDGKASNEAATFGQVQSHTAPRLSTYCGDAFAGMKDGVSNGEIDTLADWPITSDCILQRGAGDKDAVLVAKLFKPCASPDGVTLCLYLNRTEPIGTVSFDAGQSTGSISFSGASDEYWSLKPGDLVSLTRPHPCVDSGEGLVVVINASVLPTCTATGT